MCRTPDGVVVPACDSTPVPDNGRTQELIHLLAFHVEPLELAILIHNVIVDERKQWLEFRMQMYEQQLGEMFSEENFNSAAEYMIEVYREAGTLDEIFQLVEDMAPR
jgi:Cft2 family RNA processing exonuclease